MNTNGSTRLVIISLLLLLCAVALSIPLVLRLREEGERNKVSVVQHVVYTPDGAHLVSDDQTNLRIWKVDPTTHQAYVVMTFRDALKSKGAQRLHVLPDNQRIATLSEGILSVWDLSTHQALWHDTQTLDYITVAPAPDNKTLAVSTYANNLQPILATLDAASGKVIKKWQPDGMVSAIIWNKAQIITASWTHTRGGPPPLKRAVDHGVIEAWNNQGQRQWRLPLGQSPQIRFMAISPDGTMLATNAEALRAIKLWDLATQKCSATIPVGSATPSWITDLAWRGPELLIATNEAVTQWDVSQARPKLVRTTPAPSVFNVTTTLAPDGRSAAYADFKTIQTIALP